MERERESELFGQGVVYAERVDWQFSNNNLEQTIKFGWKMIVWMIHLMEREREKFKWLIKLWKKTKLVKNEVTRQETVKVEVWIDLEFLKESSKWLWIENLSNGKLRSLDKLGKHTTVCVLPDHHLTYK